jgi:hypothetical protein
MSYSASRNVLPFLDELEAQFGSSDLSFNGKSLSSIAATLRADMDSVFEDVANGVFPVRCIYWV